MERKVSFSKEEFDHLMHLGTLAGQPSIINEAIASGNIFDPAHLQKAQQLADEWARVTAELETFTRSHAENIPPQRGTV